MNFRGEATVETAGWDSHQLSLIQRLFAIFSSSHLLRIPQDLIMEESDVEVSPIHRDVSSIQPPPDGVPATKLITALASPTPTLFLCYRFSPQWPVSGRTISCPDVSKVAGFVSRSRSVSLARGHRAEPESVSNLMTESSIRTGRG